MKRKQWSAAPGVPLLQRLWTCPEERGATERSHRQVATPGRRGVSNQTARRSMKHKVRNLVTRKSTMFHNAVKIYVNPLKADLLHPSLKQNSCNLFGILQQEKHILPKTFNFVSLSIIGEGLQKDHSNAISSST
ncbi:uncharacterized protein ACIB01_000283 isoform 1-T2 [Guaruba guarouba]